MTTSGQVYAVLPGAVTLLSTSPAAAISGDTLFWTYTNLLPGQGAFFSILTQLPATTTLGTVLHAHTLAGSLQTDPTPLNNVAHNYRTVIGSYDPNDKAVSPVGPISPVQVSEGQELVYKIRFQNTGTYYAFNILVTDTLSGHLDIGSFKMLSASHNYNLSLRDNGILEWHFPNIMLPDSNMNEPESHGYILYSIKAKTNLQVNYEILNTAYIFFDFNDAIITNTTSTMVKLPNSISGAIQDNNLLVYPNPGNGKFNIALSSESNEKIHIRVFNLLGKEVLQGPKTVLPQQKIMELDLHHQPSGIYLLQLQ
ncbi:MAG: T9SS type A sorting domain-containing protein, partial [Sphingobacteriales bacterium]